MQIVAAIADDWGFRPSRLGKAVWCRLSFGGSTDGESNPRSAT
jgi:hypothetical protein